MELNFGSFRFKLFSNSSITPAITFRSVWFQLQLPTNEFGDKVQGHLRLVPGGRVTCIANHQQPQVVHRPGGVTVFSTILCSNVKKILPDVSSWLLNPISIIDLLLCSEEGLLARPVLHGKEHLHYAGMMTDNVIVAIVEHNRIFFQ